MTTTTDRPAVPTDLVPLRELINHRPGATESRLRTLRRKGELRVWKLGSGPRPAPFVSISDWDALFDLAAREDDELPTP